MGVKGTLIAAADWLFPYIRKCVCCGVEKGVEDYLCKRCSKELEALKEGEVKAAGLNAYSLYKYDGKVKSLVTGYKYNGRKWLSRFMGDSISGLLTSLPLKIDCVCNVPLHDKRRKTRGFDQSEEIAKRISETTGIPFIPALRRVRNTKTQTKLSEKQRKENMKGAFEKAAQVSGNALLIDDVLTTGATAGECAAVLKAAGAQEVYVMTFARAEMRGSKEPKSRLRRMIKRYLKV